MSEYLKKALPRAPESDEAVRVAGDDRAADLAQARQGSRRPVGHDQLDQDDLADDELESPGAS